MTRIKKIIGFKGYFVTDSGKVLSEYKGNFKWLKPCKCRGGYLQVHLYKEGKTYKKKAHRLVAEAFIDNPENKPCVDHINGVRDDNRVCNLRWCTQQENNNFPLAKKNKSEALKGRQSPMKGKPSPMKGKPKPEGAGKQPKQVIQYTKKGVLIATYYSTSEASRKTGVNQGNISSACNGKLSSAGGFKWKYAS